MYVLIVSLFVNIVDLKLSKGNIVLFYSLCLRLKKNETLFIVELWYIEIKMIVFYINNLL